MDFGGPKRVPVTGSEFVRDEIVKELLHVLEVAHVARRAEHGRIPNRVQSLD
jgi:hypothetical protein